MAALRFLLVAMLLALPMLLWATPAYACSCPPPQTFEEQVNRADLIVIGSAQAVPLDPSPMPMPLSPPGGFDIVPAELQIAVEQYIKGSGPDLLALPASLGSMCSMFSTQPARYLLFLTWRDDNYVQPSSCDGSAPMLPGSEAFFVDYIAQIRLILEGPISAPPLGTGSGESNASYLPVVSTGSAGILLVAVGLFLRRRFDARD